MAIGLGLLMAVFRHADLARRAATVVHDEGHDQLEGLGRVNTNFGYVDRARCSSTRYWVYLIELGQIQNAAANGSEISMRDCD